MMKKTLVYILSEKHSGSTWVSYVLGSHNNSANLGEYYRPFIDKSHPECDICNALGRLPCKVLHGIHNVPIPKAYDFAFERYRKDILIDSGKEISWAHKIYKLSGFASRAIHYIKSPSEIIRRFSKDGKVNSHNYNILLLHLVRDPRGWYASEKRRGKNNVEHEIKRWVLSNSQMMKFAKTTMLPYRVVSYDYLAANPKEYYPEICKFIGLNFETEALEYWNSEHHCLGGINGAGYNVLKKYESANVKTADEGFYKDNLNRNFYDQRWKEQLTQEEIKYINNNIEVNKILAESHIDLKNLDTLLP